MNALYQKIFLLPSGFGFILGILYYFDQEIDIRLPLIAIILYVVLCFIHIYSFSGSFLVGIMVLFFAAPALPLMSYFVFDEVNWGWLPSLASAINLELNRKIAIIIAVGCSGLMAGSLLFSSRTLIKEKNHKNYNPLQTFWFCMLCLMAIFLSYLSAPTASIFAGEYGGEQLNTIANSINFAGAYVLSYAIFIALAIDQLRDYTQQAKIKKKILLFSISYVIIFLQFLRGDRESLGLIMSLMVIYVIRKTLNCKSQVIIKKDIRARILKVLTFSIFGVFLLLAIGILRFTVSHGVFGIVDIFRANPWIMALTSFIAFFDAGLDENLLYGDTYLEYVLSLPPGVLTNLIGVRRAIEADDSLAVSLVETGLTSGGAHVALVPFQNFGIFGVFVIMMLYGSLARIVETNALKSMGLSLFVWLNLIAAVPMWFWYGEMPAIRGIMAAIITFWILKISNLKRTRNVYGENA